MGEMAWIYTSISLSPRISAQTGHSLPPPFSILPKVSYPCSQLVAFQGCFGLAQDCAGPFAHENSSLGPNQCSNAFFLLGGGVLLCK